LLFGVVASVVFYLVETILQAALLARQRPSVSRTWYRNYAAAFPEPFTFAVFGYGVYVVSGLLGIWIGVLIFALPTIWRYKVLASRTRTMRTTRDLLRSIAKTVDLKNGAAAAHASSVAITSVAIARQMGLAEALVEDIENAGILHDLGKASWPSKVLEQRAYLNPKDERYRHVHPDMSARIAMWAGYSESVAAAIRTHHENYDGSGYTRGLKGLAIPLGGRILRLADSFSEMVQTGDPRFARTLPEAVREVRFRSGKQFDPEMVKALLQVLERAVFPEPTPPEGDKPSEMTEPVGARG
jgi:putative nucleotidyltransferase with HDIG domain